MAERGKYIVFEGGEHTGKSTQTMRLAESIGARLVREPGGTNVGERIRDILLDGLLDKTPEAQVLLHAAQRAELVRNIVIPALDAGRHVISDRSWISSGAYQGTQGIDLTTIRAINTFAIGSLIQPDLLFILDADPATVAERAEHKTKDYYEAEGLAFHNQVRENLLFIGQQMGGFVVDAMQPVDVVAQDIRSTVRKTLGI